VGARQLVNRGQPEAGAAEEEHGDEGGGAVQAVAAAGMQGNLTT